MTRHRLQWFIDRIGKDIYRKDCGNRSVTVSSEHHAKYLHMVQIDLNLYYSDKPFK